MGRRVKRADIVGREWSAVIILVGIIFYAIVRWGGVNAGVAAIRVCLAIVFVAQERIPDALHDQIVVAGGRGVGAVRL
jgi:hypothetical protein